MHGARSAPPASPACSIDDRCIHTHACMQIAWQASSRLEQRQYAYRCVPRCARLPCAHAPAFQPLFSSPPSSPLPPPSLSPPRASGCGGICTLGTGPHAQDVINHDSTDGRHCAVPPHPPSLQLPAKSFILWHARCVPSVSACMHVLLALPMHPWETLPCTRDGRG